MTACLESRRHPFSRPSGWKRMEEIHWCLDVLYSIWYDFQWRSHRGPEGPSPQRMRKNIKASLVNLTLNMRCKNDKNIKFVITRFIFSSSKCTKIRFRPGLRSRHSRLGMGIPLPIPIPTRRLRRLELGALRRLGSQAPSTQNPGYASGNFTRVLVHFGSCQG